MKRWGFHGLRASHGVSVVHRSLGATGQRQDPGKVFKNKKMAGHMGAHRKTIQNCYVRRCLLWGGHACDAALTAISHPALLAVATGRQGGHRPQPALRPWGGPGSRGMAHTCPHSRAHTRALLARSTGRVLTLPARAASRPRRSPAMAPRHSGHGPPRDRRRQACAPTRCLCADLPPGRARRPPPRAHRAAVGQGPLHRARRIGALLARSASLHGQRPSPPQTPDAKTMVSATSCHDARFSPVQRDPCNISLTQSHNVEKSHPHGHPWAGLDVQGGGGQKYHGFHAGRREVLPPARARCGVLGALVAW